MRGNPPKMKQRCSVLLLALTAGMVLFSLARCATFSNNLTHASYLLKLTWKSGNSTVAGSPDLTMDDFPMRWPVGGGDQRVGTITQGYGFRLDPITGVSALHPGIDIAAKLGTPVVAAGAGKVTEVGFTRDMGNHVIVTHKSGFRTMYAHMQDGVLVKNGDNVAAGEYIGRVGDTGYGMGAHLEFQVAFGGDMIDPMEILDGTIGAMQAGTHPQPAASSVSGLPMDFAPRLWPVMSAAASQKRPVGIITTMFGPTVDPFTGRASYHAGIDIAWAVGTPVIATASGTVDEVGYSDRLGNYVRLRHEGGFTTFYAHLQLAEVRRGQAVAAGQEIGKIGITGLTTGPHLHYEIAWDEETRDPLKLIDPALIARAKR